MKNNTSNEGQVIVITGGTSGLGKEAVKQLAKRNTTVVIIARNMELAEKVKEETIAYSNNHKIDFINGDLSSLKSVKEAAEVIRKKYPKINVLINNAGIFNNKRILTEDGYESTFAVDYLAHFYLVSLLIEQIKAGAPSRIINVASDIHLFFGLKIDNLQQEKRYRSQKAYGNAKAAMVLHAYELHNRLQGTGITVNAFHPGHILTKMTTDSLPKILIKLNRGYITPEEAAKPLVHLATAKDLETTSGKYFRKFKIAKSSKQSYDRELQQRLWKASIELVQKKIPEFKPKI